MQMHTEFVSAHSNKVNNRAVDQNYIFRQNQ